MLLDLRSKSDLAGAALAAAVVVLLAFADGGFFPESWTPATVGLLAAAGLAAVVRRRVTASRVQLVVAGALAALVAWAAASSLWSPDSAASLGEARRTLVYVAAALAGAVVGGALLAGTLTGIAVVCAYSVGERLVAGAPSPPDQFEGTLLHEPLGYANGLAALAAVGLALAAALVFAGGRQRLLGGALCVLFAATLWLTESRGGWAAAVAGLAVVLALGMGRPRLARALVAAAGVLLALLLAAPAVAPAEDLAERVGDRAWYWDVAWQGVGEAPLHGLGAGAFHLAWLERRPVPVEVLDAHSLYLETLAELGLVGLALLALALGPPLVAALRGGGAVAGGAYVAFLLHAGVDWDWELPAVTVTGLLCGVSLLCSKRGVQESGASGIMERESSLQEPR